MAKYVWKKSALALSLKRNKGYVICVINTLGSNAVNYTLSNKMWLVLNSV